jgi:hypothetical protein
VIKPFGEGQIESDSDGEEEVDGKEVKDNAVDCGNNGTSSRENAGQADEDEERDYLSLLSVNTCL